MVSEASVGMVFVGFGLTAGVVEGADCVGTGAAVDPMLEPTAASGRDPQPINRRSSVSGGNIVRNEWFLRNKGIHLGFVG